MQHPILTQTERTSPVTPSLLQRWSADRRGSAAIEFAIVSMPFLVFAFGILLVGLQFFTNNSMEHAVEAAAREIRTGQAQKAGKTVDQFKQMICAHAVGYVTCGSDLVVHVQSAADWSTIVPRPCVTGNSLTPPVGNSTDALNTQSGGAGSAVLITACYKWELGQDLWQAVYNLFMVGSWSGGATRTTAPITVLQAATTFKTEPYE